MYNLMPRYLAQRTKTRLDVYDALPGRVQIMKEYLCEELGISTSVEQERCLQNLCAGLVACTGVTRIVRLLWGREVEADTDSAFGRFFARLISQGPYKEPWKEPLLQLRFEDKALAAVAIKAYELVRTLLPHIADRRFDYESHRLLVIALDLKDDTLLDIILQYLESSGKITREGWARFDVLSATLSTVRLRRLPQLKRLLNNLHSSGYRLARGDYFTWLRASLQMENAEIVRGVCNLRSESACTLTPKMIKEAFALGTVEAVKVILETVDLNKGNIKTLPLNVAILTRKLELVEAVLDAGADINFRAPKSCGTSKAGVTGPYKSPIEVAMLVTTPILGCLVERGATIPHISRWIYRDRRVFEFLRGASIARDKNAQIPTYDEIQRMTDEEVARL